MERTHKIESYVYGTFSQQLRHSLRRRVRLMEPVGASSFLKRAAPPFPRRHLQSQSFFTLVSSSNQATCAWLLMRLRSTVWRPEAPSEVTEKSTARRLHRTRGTDAHFSRAHVINAHALAQDLTVKDMWIVCLRALIKSHSFVSRFVVHYLSHSSLRPTRSHHSAPHHLLHRHRCRIRE